MQLMAGDEWSSCLPDRTRIVRTRSKNGAQRERLQEMLRSTFLKREDFYGDEFELLWFAALDKSLTRARRT